MPWVRAPQLLSRAPPRARIVCAYLYWSTLIVELDRLPGKLRDELCAHGIVVGLAGTRLTL
jgi:hypothetical protein